MTRPKEAASSMAAKLRKLGAEVLELPAIQTTAKKENTALFTAFSHLQTYDWIAFTSPKGVKVFFEEMQKAKVDARKLGNAKFAVVGTGTQKALQERGFFADVMPKLFDGVTLGKMLCEKCSGTEKILLPRAEIGSQEIIEELKKKAGITIDDIGIYETLYEKSEIIDEKKEFEAGSIDCAVFTSASTVKGFVEAVPELDYSKVKAACIGKQTKAAADKYSMETYMSKEASIDSLLELVIELKKNSEKKEL